MMPGLSGLELLAEITRLSRDTVVILISDNLTIQSAIEAMRRGAFDYVTKPCDLSEVETAVARALRHQSLLKANQQYEQHLEFMKNAKNGRRYPLLSAYYVRGPDRKRMGQITESREIGTKE